MSASTLQLQDAPVFEGAVFRALLLGAVAGLLHSVAAAGGAYLPSFYLAPVAALSAYGFRRGLGLWPGLVLAGFVAAAVAALGFGGSGTIAGVGAAAGAGVCLLRREDRARAGAVTLPGVWTGVVAAAAGGGLALVAEGVSFALTQRLQLASVPSLLVGPLVTGSAAFLMSLAALPAHLRLREDPVTALAEEVLPQLSGRLCELGTRAVVLYRDCAQQVAALPPDPWRAQLSRTLSELARGALEHAREWADVEAQLEAPGEEERGAASARLEAELAVTRDPVARAHLRVAVDAQHEEAARLDALERERVRAVARMEAELAMLTRARGALMSARAGRAQLKSAELAALCRKVGALANTQALEAEVMSGVAEGAELDQVSAARAGAAAVR